METRKVWIETTAVNVVVAVKIELAKWVLAGGGGVGGCNKGGDWESGDCDVDEGCDKEGGISADVEEGDSKRALLPLQLQHSIIFIILIIILIQTTEFSNINTLL